MILAVLCLKANAQKDTLFYKVDTAGQIAYIQDVFKLNTSLNKSELFKRSKQFIASNVTSSSLQLNYDNVDDGKLIFTQTQNLLIPQGVGSLPYEVKYTFTIEVKDAKVRYTVNNIEFAYKTIVGSILKRVTAYDEWYECKGGKRYNNDTKRLFSLQDHILGLANNLYAIVSKGNTNIAGDF